MPDGWKIRVDDAAALRQIRFLETALSDLRPLWPVIVRLYRSWIRQQFETSGAYGGQSWPALSPAYAAWKSVHWPGRGILVASGQMRRAMDNPERRVTPRSLTLTFESDVLPFHESGTARMPARPVVLSSPLPAAAEAELRVAAEVYVRDLLKRF